MMYPETPAHSTGHRRRRRRRPPARLLVLRLLLLVLLAALAPLAAAHAQDAAPGNLEAVERRVEAARAALSDLEQHFADATRLEADFELELRLQEGLLMLEVGDPDRASIYFLDIISRDAWAAKPGYQQARFLLAQALFDSGHHQSARQHLMQVIRSGRPEDYQPAITLLIEVGIATDDWSGVEEVFAELEKTQAGRAQPELLYARGKGLYAEKRFEEALAAFARVDPASPVALRARYFAGTTRIRLGRIDEAHSDFTAVIEHARTLDAATQNDPRTRDVVELAHMARARIHYERGQWTEALDAYQNVPRSSRHWDQALFEITWTHVRQGEIKAALRNLDILMLARPDSLFMPEAQRLAADLLKDAGEFEDALETYERVLDAYEPVLTELDAMVDGHPDTLAFFQDLVASDELGRAQYLPRSAARFVKPDEQMNRATAMVSGLGQSHENIDESWLLIEEIEAAIGSESRYELFPQVRGAWQGAMEYEARLLGLMRDLNNTEADHLALSGQGPAFEARRAAEIAYAELPQSRDAFLARERTLRMALEDRRMQAFRLRTRIDSARTQLEAVERWLLLEAARAGVSADEEAALRQDLYAAHDEIQALERDLAKLERDMRITSSLGGIDDSLATREAEVREAYKLALLHEKEALAAARAGRTDAVLERIDRARQEVRRLDADLQTWRSQIVAAVDARVEDVRTRLAVEKSLLGDYVARYDGLHGDVKLAAGHVAHDHWQRTRVLFADLVLAADVGVVDVAWLKKDRRSREVDDLIATRNKEREILQQDFEQVLRELGQKTEP